MTITTRLPPSHLTALEKRLFSACEAMLADYAEWGHLEGDNPETDGILADARAAVDATFRAERRVSALEFCVSLEDEVCRGHEELSLSFGKWLREVLAAEAAVRAAIAKAGA